MMIIKDQHYWMDENFFHCLEDYKFCDRGRRILIETKPYFHPEEKVALYSMLQMKPVGSEIQKWHRKQHDFPN